MSLEEMVCKEKKKQTQQKKNQKKTKTMLKLYLNITFMSPGDFDC